MELGGGASKGKRNGRYRTGLFTTELVQARQYIKTLARLARETVED